MASRLPPSPPCSLVGTDDFGEVADEVAGGVALGLTSVVIPAGLVFCRTFFVLGKLLSFLYFIRLFWNHTLIWRRDKPIA